LKPGNSVGVREKSKSLQSISGSLEANSSIYEWMTWNSSTYEGNFVSIPQRNQIPENIKNN
jgi:small subunit ribosomal protein S4